jgi:hypothetical protein
MITDSAVGLNAGLIFKKFDCKFRFSLQDQGKRKKKKKKKGGGKKGEGGERMQKGVRGNGRSRGGCARDWLTVYPVLHRS